MGNPPTSGVQARTRAAILSATASVLAGDRAATLPDIANAAGVGRTTLHRYFADRERLVHEAILEAIRVLDSVVTDAALDDGSAADAMRRLIAALVSIEDQVLFLFSDATTLERVAPAERPDDARILALIRRGQSEATLDPEFSDIWIEHAMFALVLQACTDVKTGSLPRHVAIPTVIRTFERGVGAGGH